MSLSLERVSRRDFLRVVPVAGASLVIGFRLFEDGAMAADPGTAGATSPLKKPARLAPNAFVQIDETGLVTLWTNKSEMGQGVRTALPMILAEELGADLSKARIEQAWFDKKFIDLDTGGSSSVRSNWDPLRKAGAAARSMLLTAAAARWKVPGSSCVVEKGQVIHTATKRRYDFGALVADAAKLPVPQDAPLKDPKDYTLVGHTLPRTDTPLKVDGSARYGIDVKVPGMLYAAAVLPPSFGAEPGRFDDARAKAVPGVRGVVPFKRGVAVVADSTWAAFKGRDALDVKWKEETRDFESSATIKAQFETLLKKPGKVLRTQGDVTKALGSAARRIEATYELPFQAHAAMEPVNATVSVTKDRCEVWAPTQIPSWAWGELKSLLKLPGEAIRINITFLGGGFGRRINPDFILDAAEISKAIGAPVKLVWSREQDLQHDFYRPASLHKMTGGFDDKGTPLAWSHRIASTSISAFYEPDTKEPEGDELGGAADVPYQIPNLQVEYAPAVSKVPRGWWRSVDSSVNGFAVESFIDEMAAAAGKDPVQFRLEMIGAPRTMTYPKQTFVQETGRLKAVIDLAAKKSSWGAPLGAGRGRGFASHYSFRSYCAMAAEVEVSGSGALRVNRIVAAVDCGRVINPGLAASQIESAVVFGLSAAIKSAITIDKGRTVQSNFDDYELLRIEEMPKVEVYFVPSTAPPSGIGEPGVPVVAPAVFNAIFAATGKRIRRLPLAAGDLASA